MDRLGSLIWLCGLPCLLVLVSWRTISCPYTKVEESFTIQAVHDILSYGVGPNALIRYDHQAFPGAVPRSFIGPLLLAAISFPFITLSRVLRVVETSADVQLIVRLCLAAINAIAVAFFCHQSFRSRTKVDKQSSTGIPRKHQVQAGLFLLITATQFHFAFWASRTIPNSLSLPLVVVAMGLMCRNFGAGNKPNQVLGDARKAICLLSFSAVVLRLEIVATLVPVGLFLCATGRIGFVDGIKTGIVSGTASVLFTTLIDTYFWQDLSHKSANNIFGVLATSLRGVTAEPRSYPLWPELHGLLFNVVEGKSSEWGVSPWHAYVTVLVPKLLALTSPLVLLGAVQLLRWQRSAVEERARFLLLIAVTHIGILSMLGHKEWRFAFYVLPALNVVASIGAELFVRSWPGKTLLSGLIVLQIGLSWFTGYLSAINYPGGEALKLLHERLASGSASGFGSRVNVHIDVLPAMTGVTLFQSLYLDRSRSDAQHDRFSGILPAMCEEDECWIYDKTEDLPTSGPEATEAWTSFTHLLTEAPDCRILHTSSDSSERTEALATSKQPFEAIAPSISSFSGLRRKTVAQIKKDLLSLSGAIFTSHSVSRGTGLSRLEHIARLILPVVIVEEPSVWLCRRKDDLL